MGTRTVVVLESEQYEGEWMPSDLTAAVAWLSGKLESIPPEHRGSATVEIDSTTRYDSSYASISIQYARPETEEEVAARETELARHQDAARDRELQTLRALRAKYGDAE